MVFPSPPTELKKKKSDINTSPALISHFDRTLLICIDGGSLRPMSIQNKIIASGMVVFPFALHITGPSPSLYCCRPLHIRRHVSSIIASSPKWGVFLFSYL